MESTSTTDDKEITVQEATAEFFGSLVRLDCGEEGIYQGIVIEVDPSKSLIKIEKPYRNGISLGKQIAEIPGELIEDVLVVPMARSPVKVEDRTDGWIPVANKKAINLLQKDRNSRNNNKVNSLPTTSKKPNVNAPSFVPLSVQLANRKAKPEKKILSITPPLPDASSTKPKMATIRSGPQKGSIDQQKIDAPSSSVSSSSERKILAKFTPSQKQGTSSTVSDKFKQLPLFSSANQRPTITIKTKKKILSITPPADNLKNKTAMVGEGKADAKMTCPTDTNSEVISKEKKEMEKVPSILGNKPKPESKKKTEMKENTKEVKKKEEANKEKKVTKIKTKDNEAKKEVGIKTKKTIGSTAVKGPMKKEDRNKLEKEKRALAMEEAKKKKEQQEEQEKSMELELVGHKLEQLTCEEEEKESLGQEGSIKAQSSEISCLSPSSDNNNLTSSIPCSQFVGCLVSVTTEDGGMFQGKITAVNAEEQSIRLEKALL